MLERCVLLDAAYVPAYLLLARLYQGQEGRGPAVGRLLRHVARLQPNSPDHLAELAAWLHHTGKHSHRQFSVQYSLYYCTYQRFVCISEWARASGDRIQVEPRFLAPLQTSFTMVTGSNLLTYLLTPWSRVFLEKLTIFQLVKKFFRISRNRKVHYRIHKCPEPVPILSHPDPIHSLTSYFLKIQLNIIIPSTPGSPKWSLSLSFPHQNVVYASPLTHTRYMSRQSHSSRFYHPNNIG